jgi:hypothetical protein
VPLSLDTFRCIGEYAEYIAIPTNGERTMTKNENYMQATEDALDIGTAVFAYYVSSTPSDKSLGTITTADAPHPADPYQEIWYKVVFQDGSHKSFDAKRLAVLR